MKIKYFIWIGLLAIASGFDRSAFAQPTVVPVCSNNRSQCQDVLADGTVRSRIDKTAVLFVNTTDRSVEVETFNENDGLRWVAYQKTTIPAKQRSYVAAQGNNIQIVVDRNRSNIHRCLKGQYCAWDGQTLVAK